MRDIKTRQHITGTIKTIDRSAVAARRMKRAYLKTKEQAIKSKDDYTAPESNAANEVVQETEYAANNTIHTVHKGLQKARKRRIEQIHTQPEQSSYTCDTQAKSYSYTKNPRAEPPSASTVQAQMKRLTIHKAQAKADEKAQEWIPSQAPTQIQMRVKQYNTTSQKSDNTAAYTEKKTILHKDESVRTNKFNTRTLRTRDVDTVQIKTAASAKEKAVSVTAAKQKAAIKAAQNVAVSNGLSQRRLEITKKAALVTEKALKRILQSLAAVMKSTLTMLGIGGATAGMVAVVICLVGVLLGSSYGILFCTEDTGEYSVQDAIREINAEYQAEIEAIKSEYSYDELSMSGSKADWREILAVYAVMITTDESEGAEVITMNDAKKAVLRDIFWDMNEISSSTETYTETQITEEEDEEGNIVEVETVIERSRLCIVREHRSGEEMLSIYSFNRNQKKQYYELTAKMEELNFYIGGDIDFTDADAVALWDSLPMDLAEDRREVLRYALSLVGKVQYFWGGKSLTLGWDDRWGTSMLVTASGSSSSGTYRPFGLDCSGFVDWAFYNASGGSYVIGQGGGCIAQHNNCYSISWSEAIPGDLVFYPGDEHIGIVGGWDDNGNILIIHCASGSQNGVYITGKVGFASIARPYWYE